MTEQSTAYSLDSTSTRPRSLGAALALLVLLLAAQILPAATYDAIGGDKALELFPESADLRKTHWESFFAAPKSAALSRRPTFLSNDAGGFRLSSIKSGDSFYLILSAVSPMAAGAVGPMAKASEEPPLYRQGSWIFKRSSSDGRMIQAKVFLRSDPGTFIRIYPAGDRSRLDLLLYGGVLKREVPLPLPFDKACRLPLREIVSMTGDIVDWQLFSPRPGLYRDLRSLVSAVRARLPGLRYADDGALDAEGRPVYIATGEPQRGEYGLNCSGFAKWLVDGLYRPLTGKSLEPREMARRNLGIRGSPLTKPYEELLDPFFGLDWTRNIGKAYADARSPSREHGLTENDVSLSPFALLSDGSSRQALDAKNGSPDYEYYPAFQENLGYEARGLAPILYQLAIDEPGSLYLASVSGIKGAAPPLKRASYHVAVLIPYFEEDGVFRVAVFESAAETSLSALISRAPRDFVHLVRIPASPDFDPPPFPKP